MELIIVTGTDTGVGKTVAAAALAANALAAGRSVYLVKPVQTGAADQADGDLAEVRRLVGDLPGHEGARLAPPLAPDAAARLTGATLPTCAEQAEGILALTGHDTVVVEGSGGVRVRLGEGWDLLDLADRFHAEGADVEFVVVTRAGLGALNHAALTVDAVRGRGLNVRGLVIGSWPADPDQASLQNLADLPDYTGVPLLGRIPAGAGRLEAAEFRAAAGDWLAPQPNSTSNNGA